MSDLVLVCSDGSLPAHAALLAPASPFLAGLLAGPGGPGPHCPGCPAPRHLTLAGVRVRECRALLQMLYTGQAPLTTELTRILELAATLGMEVDRLDVVSTATSLLFGSLRPAGRDETVTDHTRPQRSGGAVATLPNREDAESELRNSGGGGGAMGRPRLLSRHRESARAARVQVPHSVLNDVMDILSDTNIKQEPEEEVTEEEIENYVAPEMDGKEEGEKGDRKSVDKEYLSMNNSRNFVCAGCDQGFTFERSYNWHKARCRGGAAAGHGKPAKIGRQENCPLCRRSVASVTSHLALLHFKEQIISDYCSYPRQCRLCRKSFKSLHSLVLHVGLEHEVAHSFLQAKLNGKRVKLKKTLPDDFVHERKTEKEPAKVRSVKSNRKSVKSSSRMSCAKKKSPNDSTDGIKTEIHAQISKPKSNLSTEPHPKLKEVHDEMLLECPLISMNAVTKNKFSKENPSVDADLKESLLSKKCIANKLAGLSGSGKGRREGCGVCSKCRLPDCGICPACSRRSTPGPHLLSGRVCVKKVCRSKIWVEG